MPTQTDYDVLADLLEREYGVDLRAAGPDVLQAKIGKYCERHGLASLADCIRYIQEDGGRASDLGDVVYSQRTCFNRSPEDFEFLVERVLRRRAERAARAREPLRIWCAACSTGQEAYTIGIYLLERVFPAEAAHSGEFRVFASDCSRASLTRARAGRYHPIDVQQLDPIPRDKYFVDGGGGYFVVAPHVRRSVEFSEVNLVTSQYEFERSLDFVFLRNALDFHNDRSRGAILSKVRATLKDGGWLVLGDCPRLDPRDVARLGYAVDAPGCYRVAAT